MKISEGMTALVDRKEEGKANFGDIWRKNEEGRLIMLDPEKITPNPFQPRRDFDEEGSRSLMESIRENGILQPLTVRKGKNGFELVAGERRLRAAKELGLKSVPCVLRRYSDEQSSVLALVENIQRRQLNFFEEADAIGRLIVYHGLTQEQVAARLGKSQPAVANKLRLLRLREGIRVRITASGLTERHARAMLRLPEERIEKALDTVILKGYNVAQTEEYIEKLLTDKQTAKGKKRAVIRDMRIFCNTLDKAVRSIKSTGLKIESERNEKENYIEYLIKLPKK